MNRLTKWLRRGYGSVGDRIADHWITRYVFYTKNTYEVGSGQIGFILGILYASSSIIILLDFLSITVTPEQALTYLPLVIVLVTIFGFVFKRLGLQKADKVANAKLDPVLDEIYRAARKINNEPGSN